MLVKTLKSDGKLRWIIVNFSCSVSLEFLCFFFFLCMWWFYFSPIKLLFKKVSEGIFLNSKYWENCKARKQSLPKDFLNSHLTVHIQLFLYFLFVILLVVLRYYGGGYSQRIVKFPAFLKVDSVTLVAIKHKYKHFFSVKLSKWAVS